MATDAVKRPISRRRFFRPLVGGGLLIAGLLGCWFYERAKEAAAITRLRENARIEQQRIFLFPFPQIFSSANQERLLPRIYSMEGIHFHPQTSHPGQYLRGVPLHSVTSVGFDGATLSPDDLAALREHPKLTSLKFKSCKLLTGTLQTLGKLPELQELRSESCRLPMDWSIDGSVFPKLRYLNTFNTDLSDQMIEIICEHPQLAEISLELNSNSDESLKRLCQRFHLEPDCEERVFKGLDAPPGRPRSRVEIHRSGRGNIRWGIPPERR